MNPMQALSRVSDSVAGLFSRGKANDMRTSTIVRAGMTLGPWDAQLQSFLPHRVNPYFFEALRKSMPIIDGGINALTMLDGIVRITGTNTALCETITQAMQALPVNDCEIGLQAFYALHANEIYEQGFGIGEKVMDARGRALIGLRVGDSKGMLARRNDQGNIEWWYRPPSVQLATRGNGTDDIETVLRNTQGAQSPSYLNRFNYQLLDPDRLVYGSYHPEADNPYGVSVMRSIEFVSQILLKIQNATGQSWDRYGDPPLQLTYKTKNRALKGPDLASRRNVLANDLAAVLNAKRLGNSADFVQAIGADDDIEIKIIGAQSVVLVMDIPARHMVEQILAKLGLPGWMVGLNWGTAERMADQQAEMVLMGAKTRFERRKPALRDIVATWLRGQGISWQPGEWDVAQELPNLRDVMKQAQARFLNAQADMMGAGGNSKDDVPTDDTITSDDDGNAGAVDATSGKQARIVMRTLADGETQWDFHAKRLAEKKNCTCHVKHHRSKAAQDSGSEPWAEDDSALPGIEQAAIDGLLALWQRLQDETLAALKLEHSANPAFLFDATTIMQKLSEIEDVFIAAAGDENGPLVQQMFASWARGLSNAASELDVDSVIDEARAATRDILAARGMELVKNAAARSYQEQIVANLANGAYDGLSPKDVAAKLEDEFGMQDYDWMRLARSEIARAQSLGKVDQYRALDVTQYNFVTAGDACPICDELADEGPYDIGSGPMPVDDSHPNCFPAGTMVWSPRLLGSSQRWYEGELIEIVTASGVLLTGTPNHPVLTPQGWVALKLLREGDHVIRCRDAERAVRLADPDDYHGPALIENVAVTLGTAAPVAPVTVPSAAEDFHGDGMQPDVEVVAPDGLLHHDAGDATAAQQLGKSDFTGVNSYAAQLASERTLETTFIRVAPSARSAVGSADESLAVGHGSDAHPQIHACGASAYDDARIAEAAAKCGATDPGAIGDRLEAFAGLIALDQVLQVRNLQFSDHVYNLETVTGWYIAGGIVTHNCRCSIAAVEPKDDSDNEDG